MAGTKGRSGGGARKSIEQLKLDGTYRAIRHDGHELSDGVQVTPEASITNDFTVDREAVFTRFAEILHEQQLTSDVDSIIVTQLTDTYCAYVQASEFVVVNGIEAKLGPKLAVSVQSELARTIRELLAEFRLTPSTRAKATRDSNAESKDSADPVGDFLAKPKLVKG
jgi:hypothetical protein